MYDNSTRKSLRQKVQVHPDGSREYWRDVPGYQGYYRISDKARVKSLGRFVKCCYGSKQWRPEKILTPKIDKNGYSNVSLSRDGKKYYCGVHTLILLAFVGPKPRGMQCRHLNGKPWNNNPKNLCWGTSKEDRQDMIRHGTIATGERHGCSKLTEKQVLKIRRLRSYGTKLKELETMFGISTTMVKSIIYRKNWKHI